jgi:hypothetical protein
MDYYGYRELRTLVLQSRILAHRIEVERLQEKPNRFRLLHLEKIRFSVLDRIAGYLQQQSLRTQVPT